MRETNFPLDERRGRFPGMRVSERSSEIRCRTVHGLRGLRRPRVFRCRRNTILLILLLFGAFLRTAALAQRFERGTLAVWEAAAARDAAALLALMGTSSSIDREVLYALASVQSDSAIEPLIAALSSPEPETRVAAAFAVGQTLRVSEKVSRYEDVLGDRLRHETDGRVKAELLDGAGRFGSASLLAGIAALDLDDALLIRAQARSIARFAIRGVKSKAAAEKAGALLPAIARDLPDADVNDAAYALMRIGDSALLAGQEHALVESAGDRNANARMHAVAALGALRTTSARRAIVSALGDADWRVRVNAIRALARCATQTDAYQDIMRMLAAQLRAGNHHTVKTALQIAAQLPFTHQRIAGMLMALIDSSSSPDLRDEATRTLAEGYPDLIRARIDGWMRLEAPRPAWLEAAGILARRERAVTPAHTVWIMRYLQHTDRAIAAAAIAALAQCRRTARNAPGSDGDRPYEDAMLRALDVQSDSAHRSGGAVQLIAESLADSLHRREEYARPLAEALARFSSADNVETVLALVQAVAATGSRADIASLRALAADRNGAVRDAVARVLRAHRIEIPEAAAVAPPPSPRDWSLVQSFARDPEAVIGTSRGTIRIRLFLGEAPCTVESFIRLARQGFYDGLTFHRVVPNFVAQGGDPGGDGSGGPPYTLRSEFTRRSFLRGAVGIASAGKDTEGSQFFIMHSAHPHLDGRYTLFGEVTHGMEAADALEVGDRILHIEIAE